jgi:hypothetical protein
MVRPASMSRERVPFRPDSPHVQWLAESGLQPIVGPLEYIAEQLGQPLELVQAAAEHVEPYVRVDGRPVWSVHLLAVALGLRRSRRERQRKRNQGSPEYRARANARRRAARAEQWAG